MNMSGVTLNSNKSHLARVESLQPSNIPLIVRCFQAWCQVKRKKREKKAAHKDTNTSRTHTREPNQKTNEHTTYRQTNRKNVRIVFVTYSSDCKEHHVHYAQ